MANNSGGSLLVIERLLRDRDGIWRQIIEERSLKQLTGQMLVSSALSLALYGGVLGASNGWLQAASSFIKLPLLFLATLAICLPTLYLFNLVFGARLSVMQAVTLIMVTITVTSVLTLAFAPISLFFLITAQSYEFFKVLNVGILVLTAVVGLRFLTAGMTAFNQHQVAVAQEAMRVERVAAEQARIAAEVAEPEVKPDLVTVGAPSAAAGNGAVPVQSTGTPLPHAQQLFPFPNGHPHQALPHHDPRRAPLAPQLPAGQRPASMTLLNIWILLFGFVGTQLAWTLRPFFGSPGEPFEVFRKVGGTFYGDILTTIGTAQPAQKSATVIVMALPLMVTVSPMIPQYMAAADPLTTTPPASACTLP
jgi:hypothetical protein